MSCLYRVRLYAADQLLTQAHLTLLAPSRVSEFAAGCRAALAEAGVRDARVEVVELDPATGTPRRPTTIERALDELLGELR